MASRDEKEIAHKDTLMTAEQLRGEAKPPAPTAPRKSRELLKELTKSKKKGSQAGPHCPELLGPSLQTQSKTGGEQKSLPK